MTYLAWIAKLEKSSLLPDSASTWIESFSPSAWGCLARGSTFTL